jgi:16S rRNA (adenine1518-N6/adenine1519-N6)-dimethyltransferase
MQPDSIAQQLAHLPPLRETIARHGLDARRALGQHFLLDLNLTRRIARAAGDLSAGTTIEIGPGPGGLTRALLLEGAARLVAIEKDARAVAAMRELAGSCGGRLEVIEADALSVDPEALGPAPRRIVANLPYNISTALLVRWLHVAPALTSMTLMFQKEVAERLVAAPRSKAYGRLSVLAQHVCEVTSLFDIPARAFVPPPKIVSTVVQLMPRDEPSTGIALADLERLTAAAFGQRRKMLRSSLRSLLPEPEQVLAAAGIAATARAEELDGASFRRLARATRDTLEK